jgi:thiamine-phosphate pyrophosphorylase
MVVRGRDPEGFGRLHVLTDADRPESVLDVVDAALAAGAPTVQVRQKAGTDRERLATVDAVLSRCRAAGATCIVNDRIDLALAAGADGVHLGADDLPVAVARRMMGADAIVGATVRDPGRARAAERDGASYVGVGPTFTTTTKDPGVAPLGVDGVAEVAAAVNIPAVAIAGVTARSAAALTSRGLAGVAVMGAVSGARDPQAACRDLLDAIEGAP